MPGTGHCPRVRLRRKLKLSIGRAIVVGNVALVVSDGRKLIDLPRDLVNGAGNEIDLPLRSLSTPKVAIARNSS